MRIVPTIRGEGDWLADDLQRVVDQLIAEQATLYEYLLRIELELAVEDVLAGRPTEMRVEVREGGMHTVYDLRGVVAQRAHFGMLDS